MTKARGRPPEPGPEDDGEEQVVVSEQTANLMDVLDEMGELAEEAVVLRWDDEGKRKDYIATFPPDQFGALFDVVRDTYGGGRYNALFKKAGRIVKNSTFYVDSRFPWRVGVTAGAPAPTPAPNGPDPRVQGEVAGLREVINSQTSLVTQLIGALVGKAVAPAAVAGEGSLDTAIKLATLLRGSDTERLGVKDLAATFREGMELGKEITNPERSDSFADVVAPFVPIVKSTLEDYMENERKKTAGAAGPPKVDGAAAALAPPKQPEVAVDLAKAPWLAHLAPFMGEIQTWAQRGWDADRYVGSMVARMPDHIVDEIEVASRDPQFVENALAALPAPFLMFKGWLTQALEALKEEVKPNEES